ncbi:amidohydrolase family protein [Paracoccus limosus]|uniref:Amidohydrolase family protein n=1 Tax=Paracoccus limosus TaxID=913252 RepID=A0A844H4B2_9RHOB|nr:amidohydrolase family protein [Paracoccus limosus]MTH34081.1 amidohydrolase family protein [Paracoccus limosus]
MQKLDAHCHFWRLDRGDYGWLAGSGSPLAPIRRDFLPPDYPADIAVIAVQAAPTLAETDFLLGLDDPRIRGVVGWADLADPDSVAALRARAGRLVGIRPMLQDIAEDDWILTAPHPEVLAALPALGLRFDALVTRRHLGPLAQFIARNPGLPVVIDHAAKPQPGEQAAWAAGMRVLAALPGVHCKLSGLMTELPPEALRDPLPALHAILAPLLDWFGPERLIWGSDWPVLTLAASHGDWLELTDSLLARLAAPERAAIMGGNGARFYGVAP